MLWASLAVGQGMDFAEGVDDLVAVPDAGSLTQTPVSFGCWAYLRSATGAEALIMKDHEYALVMDHSQNAFSVGVSFSGTTFNILLTDADPADYLNEWHHYYVVFDGATLSFYVDGVFDSAASYSGTIQNTANDFAIGIKIAEEGGYAVEYNGLLDDSRIYSTALTSNQIARLTLDTCEMYDPLIGYDLLTTVDKSGNGNDGTCTADTIITGDEKGFIGYFDYTEHLTANGALADIATATSGTVSCWFKLDQYRADNIIFSITRDADGTRTDIFVEEFSAGGMAASCNVDGTGQWTIQDSSEILSIDTWYHLAVVHDGTAAVMYIDGSPAGTFSVTTDKTKWFKGILTDAASDADTFTVGGFTINGGGTVLDLDGYAANCGVYTRAITTNEVNALANHSQGRHAPKDAISTANLEYFCNFAPAPSALHATAETWDTGYGNTNLAGAWRGDRTGKGNGNSFTNLPDLSGNGNDGTAYNSPTIEAAR